MSDVVAVARENLAYTYRTLAQAVYPQGVKQGLGYTYCNEDPSLVLASFAIGFDIPESSLSEAVTELTAHCVENPLFRLFTTDGDTPPSLPAQLAMQGFLRFSVMDVLAWEESVAPPAPDLYGLQLVEAIEPAARTRLAQFMVSIFFTRRSPSLRRLVVHSTAGSPHRLFALKSDKTIVGGLMISESEGALGLYNLCLDARYRRRRFGTALVSIAKSIAVAQNLPLVLQSDPSLGTWYVQNSFRSIGKVQIFGQSTTKS